SSGPRHHVPSQRKEPNASRHLHRLNLVWEYEPFHLMWRILGLGELLDCPRHKDNTPFTVR
ncbi:MAG: hypothetical protein ACKVIF_10925, partial [Rhodospirillales bacterium]